MIEDWRLFGNDHMKGIELIYKKYQAPSEEWDHDHCEFCWAKFSTKEPDSLTQGYATKDEYRWVCLSCFEDFREGFKFKVIGSKTRDNHYRCEEL